MKGDSVSHYLSIPNMPQLTDLQRYFICTVRQENEKKNWGFRRFCKEFPTFMADITEKKFDKVVANFNQQGIMKRAKGSGRPPLSEEVRKAVVVGLQSPPGRRGLHKSQRQVARDLGIAQSSVCKVAKKTLKCFRRVRVHILTDTHRQRRQVLAEALYARFHLGRARRSWKNVWFSDEASISLMQPVNTQNCRIYRAVQFKSLIPDEDLLVEQDRQGPSVMVYAAISWHGKTPLFYAEGRINHVKYQHMLSEHVFPAIRNQMGEQPWTWQQDGATPHTATVTQQWLQNECPDFIKKDAWPAKSPDLNPMDYGMWGILTSKVARLRNELRTTDDLKRILTLAWDDITMEDVRNTCANWGKRLQAVQSANGGYFEHKL